MLAQVQSDGEPVHSQPNSTSQLALQPSCELGLPSSHTSRPTIRPSPQTDVQLDGEPVQRQPGSTVQVEEQPSVFRRPPSSHAFRRSHAENQPVAEPLHLQRAV
jgi:hypothetical protein